MGVIRRLPLTAGWLAAPEWLAWSRRPAPPAPLTILKVLSACGGECRHNPDRRPEHANKSARQI